MWFVSWISLVCVLSIENSVRFDKRKEVLKYKTKLYIFIYFFIIRTKSNSLRHWNTVHGKSIHTKWIFHIFLHYNHKLPWLEFEMACQHKLVPNCEGEEKSYMVKKKFCSYSCIFWDLSSLVCSLNKTAHNQSDWIELIFKRFILFVSSDFLLDLGLSNLLFCFSHFSIKARFVESTSNIRLVDRLSHLRCGSLQLLQLP